MRQLLLLLPLLALLPPAHAGEPKQIAEMARMAGAFGAKDSGASLVKMLKEANDFAVRNALLDALIRVDATVPAELLTPLYGEHPDEVIILLARDPKANRGALLRLMDGKPRLLHWMAMADVLAAARQPGVAVRVWKELAVYAEIAVLPGSNMAMGMGGGTGRERSLDTKTRAKHGVQPDWPPLVRYTLTDQPKRGDVYLAGKRHRVYYRREEFKKGRVSFLALSPTVTIATFCLLNLTEFTHRTWREHGLSPNPMYTINWEGKDEFLKTANKRRQSLEWRLTNFLNTLEMMKALTEEERAALKPNIVWKVKDMSPGGGTLPIPKWP